MMSPSLSAAAFAFASSPITSVAIATGQPISSLILSATGAREYFILNSPFGLPMWLQRIIFAPFSLRYLTVLSASRIRLSSVITPSLIGTLKSQRTIHLLPLTLISSTVFLPKPAIVKTPF